MGKGVGCRLGFLHAAVDGAFANTHCYGDLPACGKPCAIGAGRPEATSPGAAAGPRQRRRGRAPGAPLVDVQLLELDVLHVTAKAYPALIWDSTCRLGIFKLVLHLPPSPLSCLS